MDWKHYKLRVVEVFMGGRFPSLMTFFCLALLAYSAARVTWMMVPLPTDEATPSGMVARAAAPAARVDAAALGREIVTRHLFGQALAVNTGQAAVIPETQLNLILRGVIASPDPRTATAIVADPGGKEDFYTVGKELPGGAVLKEVHPQHIVLSRGGRVETLRLPENILNVSQGLPSSPLPGLPAVAPEAGVLLQQYREQFLQDPQSLAEVLQGEPYWENGRLLGYRLRPGRDAGALGKFGIQAGDVVTAINGTSLADPAGRMELLRNINNVTQMNLNLLRNGQPYAIAIPLDQPG